MIGHPFHQPWNIKWSELTFWASDGLAVPDPHIHVPQEPQEPEFGEVVGDVALVTRVFVEAVPDFVGLGGNFKVKAATSRLQKKDLPVLLSRLSWLLAIDL